MAGIPLVLQCGMATELPADPAAERLEVADSVRPRLIDLATGDQDIDRMIDLALDELTPANVTTYLPILVERNVRNRLHETAPA